jgi:predicted metal-dependent enzyme (double-stranded beta helix superfamily)
MADRNDPRDCAEALAPLRQALDRAAAGSGAVGVAFFETVARLLDPLTAGLEWLPAEARRAGADGYQRHLLLNDQAGRYSVGSFVWAPGQQTPIHDHHGWGGVIGILGGTLRSEEFVRLPDGRLRAQPPLLLGPGQVAWVSAAVGDIHRLGNPSAQETAFSLHVYGCDFFSVCRNRYDERTGAIEAFPSQPWRM